MLEESNPLNFEVAILQTAQKRTLGFCLCSSVFSVVSYVVNSYFDTAIVSTWMVLVDLLSGPVTFTFCAAKGSALSRSSSL